MSKNKSKVTNPPKGKGKAADDDDWESILEAEKALNAAKAPVVAAPEPEPVKSSTVNESDDEDDEGEEADEAGGAKKDKKKKKKKGGKKEVKEEATKKPAATTTAAGRAILERQRLIAEEEARVKKLKEEEEARFKAEEEREERERLAIEEEKERKRKAKQDKVDAQKAAGVYMTKAEKEKAKKAQARLEALKASGIVVPGLAGAAAPAAVDASKGASSLYKKKTTNNNNKVDEVTKGTAAVKLNNDEDVPDSWDSPEVESTPVNNDNDDDDDDDDDWESNITAIADKIEARKEIVNNDVEDQLEVENKNDHEKLRLLGIERAKREEEARLRKEEEEAEREEMEQKEREALMRKETSRTNRLAKEVAAKAARSADRLRSPISCIMGHVDTGKTKLLDKIRHTNVQEGEAGGITQQIGATQFSRETLIAQTQCMQATLPFAINIPGLLVIDTPGHESFANLRSRGSSLCDIAILVIDLMHGLEPQTIESINLLKKKRTPFVVALNKVDRCYGWKTMPDTPFRVALAAQDENCQLEFKDRASRAILQLNEQGLNAKLYWENDDLAHTVSLVPTSAVSGEGVPDLIRMVITLTQERLLDQIMYFEALQCTVLEVKVIEGHGHTVDVVLVNGTLREGDRIVVSTLDGPVVTHIRALLTPPPNREMRVKSEYIKHAQLSGAIGVKISAPDVSKAIAGTPLMVIAAEDDDDDVKEECQADFNKLKNTLEIDNKGVSVHASTLGALEALLQFLRNECKPAIPVNRISIGPIHKKDVMLTNIMNEKNMPEYATILAFDVPVDADVKKEADEMNVRIFSAEIIYHLFDHFTAYMNKLNEAKKAAATEVVVFPCILKILPQHIFNKKDPIVIGVDVQEGTLRLNTLLCIPSIGLDVGRVTKIENNHKDVTSAKKGVQVAVRITNESNPTITYGRQFDDKQLLYSKINRASIDACKEFFKDEMTKDDWHLVIKLKKIFNIN